MRTFKILIVEDNPDQADILHTILCTEGRDVEVATRSREGLERLQENQYDLVFTDVSMPEMDGIEILKFVKTHAPKTEVVMITAFGDWGVYAEALRWGAADFLSKPYNIPEIQALADRLASSPANASSAK